MSRAVVLAGRQSDPDACADMTPVAGRHCAGRNPGLLDRVDGFEDRLDPSPSAKVQQNFGARGDKGIGREGLAGPDGAQYGNAGLDRTVFAATPTHETKERARRELNDAASTVDDALTGAAPEPDPAFDLTFQPVKRR